MMHGSSGTCSSGRNLGVAGRIILVLITLLTPVLTFLVLRIANLNSTCGMNTYFTLWCFGTAYAFLERTIYDMIQPDDLDPQHAYELNYEIALALHWLALVWRSLLYLKVGGRPRL